MKTFKEWLKLHEDDGGGDGGDFGGDIGMSGDAEIEFSDNHNDHHYGYGYGYNYGFGYPHWHGPQSHKKRKCKFGKRKNGKCRKTRKSS